MRLKLFSRYALAALAAAVTACSSSDSEPGRINVRLVDAPGDYQAITLNVQRVEIHTGDGWETLGTPDVTVNLLDLVDGVSATLVDGAELRAGRYTQLRLVLGGGNTVTLPDGSVHALTVPSGSQSGVKLNTSFEVAPNTTADLFIDFDAHRSIFVHQAGNSGKYMLRPTVRAVDRVVTGAIIGTLSDADGPLPGVEVSAQGLDATGNPVIVRSTLTTADGRYVLDLLPVGFSYHVVAQPVVRLASLPVAVYEAKASGPIQVSTAAPTPAYDATFAKLAAAPGSIAGTVLPVATDADADLVNVFQQLSAGATTQRFIIRTVGAGVVAGVESYAVDALPAGDYSVAVTRRTLDVSGGVETVSSSAAMDVSVGAGLTAPADLVL
jgi:hypothetical protein